MSYSKDELVRYRIERAKEAYEDADYLAREERWNAAANRMYYACFYVVSAYLAFRGLTATTHSGLKNVFNQELIKTGRIDRADGVLFNKLFNIRQEADYEDFSNTQPEELQPLLLKINDLIRDIEQLIKEESNYNPPAE
jgi:uncharacterized protein